MKFGLAPKFSKLFRGGTLYRYTLYYRLRRALGPLRKFQLKHFYALKYTFFWCPWIYHAGESVSISTTLPFDNKCICAFHSQSISCFDTKLWFCLINKKLSKTTPFVQVFRKNALARKTLKINVFAV